MDTRNPTTEDDIRTFRDPNTSVAERDAALVRLLPVIERVAASVAHADTPHDQAEFVGSAPAMVLVEQTRTGGRKIDRYDPARPFLPWLRTVLENAHTDARRRRRRVRYVDPGRLVDAPDVRAVEVPGADVLAGDQLLACLRAVLNVALTVEFLSLSGWHARVPDGAWNELLCEYERARGLELPRPFPGAGFDDLTTTRTRTGPLARALRYPTNTLTVRWGRAVRKLQAGAGEIRTTLAHRR